MSGSKNNPNNDDEIWNELFGDNTNTSSQKKGHHTIAPRKKEREKTKHPSKKRKIDKSSHRSQSQSSNNHQNGHHSQSHHHHQQHQQRTRSQSYHADGPTTAERLSQFLCTPKHRARLPPPPLKCKYLKYPHKKIDLSNIVQLI